MLTIKTGKIRASCAIENFPVFYNELKFYARAQGRFIGRIRLMASCSQSGFNAWEEAPPPHCRVRADGNALARLFTVCVAVPTATQAVNKLSCDKTMPLIDLVADGFDDSCACPTRGWRGSLRRNRVNRRNGRNRRGRFDGAQIARAACGGAALFAFGFG